MARIRSIKPGFFRNEELCSLSSWHRLCFAGLWLQADKAGRMEDRPKRLKADIFPYDDLDFEGLLQDLAERGFIIRYLVDGKRYICIPEDSWSKHQRPRNDEHPSALPSVTYSTGTYSSLRSDKPDTAQCLGNREVGNRENGIGSRGVGGVEDATAADAASLVATPKHRAGDLADLWNSLTHPPIPRCRELSDKRKRHCAARLRERPIEQWAEVIARIQSSSFCRGETGGKWVATFDWLVEQPDTAVKVLEGKYDDRAGPNDFETARAAFLKS